MIAVLTFSSAYATENGPELTRADLQEIAQKRNLVKGDMLFWAVDETAQRNIESAVGYMNYEAPIFVPTITSEFRYRVNSDSDSKIREVHLDGTQLSDLFVVFSEPTVNRWQNPWIRLLESRKLWALRLGEELHGDPYRSQDGSLILRHWATFAPRNTGLSLEEMEDQLSWSKIHIKIDLLHSRITKVTKPEGDVLFFVRATSEELPPEGSVVDWGGNPPTRWSQFLR